MPNCTVTLRNTLFGRRYRFEPEGFAAPCAIGYATRPNAAEYTPFAEGAPPLITARPPADGRLFFELKDDSGQSLHCATRHVQMPHITNLRDLGGYEAENGSRVRWGLLYRSAGLDRIDAAEEALLQNTGLATVYDFRSNAEVAQAADIVPKGVAYINRSGIPTMDEEPMLPGGEAGGNGNEANATDAGHNGNKGGTGGGGNLDMRELVLHAGKDPATMERLETYLIESYRVMARRPEAFAGLFRELLAAPGAPLLFHCSAGKDRTGFAAACILRLLGVPQKTVMEDYLLSNHYRRAENRSMYLKLRLVVHNKRLLNLIMGMMTVSSELLDAAFGVIEDEYGGFDAFVQKGLQLGPSDVALLREAYLE